MWTDHGIIIMVLYVLAAIIVCASILSTRGKEYMYPAIGSFVLFILAGLFLAYYTNCTSAGSCVGWDTIRTFIFCLPPIVLCALLLLAVTNQRKLPAQPTLPTSSTPSTPPTPKV